MIRPKHFYWLLIVFSFVMVLALSSCNMPLGGATPTPLPTATQITLPTPATGAISGFVWHDRCALPGEGQPPLEAPPPGCVETEGGGFRANGIYEAGEPGIEGVEVSLGIGECPSTGFASATTNSEGRFEFTDLASGIYCLFLDPGHPRNSQILIPGEWTAGDPEASGVIRKVANLSEGQDTITFEFGWDHQFLPPYEPPPTETLIPTPTQAPTETPAAEESPTPTPEEGTTPSPTPQGTQAAQDPNLPTGNPAWRDTFDSGGNWPLYEDEHVQFEVESGKAVMTAINPDFYEGWMLTWPEPTNFYLEGTFETGTCAGRDRYGLMTRSSAPSESYVGYLFGVTCDGQYSLRTWDGEEFTQLISWTSSNFINQGTGKTNRLGFWAKGSRIILYVNGKKLTEIQDDTYDDGKFGLFIGSVETDNFKVEVDEIAYWILE
jgi:hypothetical protein